MQNQCRRLQGTKTTIQAAVVSCPAAVGPGSARAPQHAPAAPLEPHTTKHTRGFVFIAVLGVLYSPAAV